MDEGDHRWSVTNRAEINIPNHSNIPRVVTIEFSMSTLKLRNVKICLEGKILKNSSLSINGAAVNIYLPLVILIPCQNTLYIETDVPADIPVNGDLRKLSFGISNLLIQEH